MPMMLLALLLSPVLALSSNPGPTPSLIELVSSWETERTTHLTLKEAESNLAGELPAGLLEVLNRVEPKPVEKEVAPKNEEDDEVAGEDDSEGEESDGDSEQEEKAVEESKPPPSTLLSKLENEIGSVVGSLKHAVNAVENEVSTVVGSVEKEVGSVVGKIEGVVGSKPAAKSKPAGKSKPAAKKAARREKRRAKRARKQAKRQARKNRKNAKKQQAGSAAAPAGSQPAGSQPAGSQPPGSKPVAAPKKAEEPVVDQKEAGELESPQVPGSVEKEVSNAAQQGDSQVEDALKHVQAQLVEANNRVDLRLAQCQQSQRELPSRLERLETELRGTEGDLGQVQGRLQAVNSRARSLDLYLQQLGERLAQENQQYSIQESELRDELGRKQKDIQSSQEIEGLTRCGAEGGIEAGAKAVLGKKEAKSGGNNVQILECKSDREECDPSGNKTGVSKNLVHFSFKSGLWKKRNYKLLEESKKLNPDNLRISGSPQLEQALSNASPELRRNFFELMLLHAGGNSTSAGPSRTAFLAQHSEQLPIPDEFKGCGCSTVNAHDKVQNSCHALNEKASILFGGSTEALARVKQRISESQARHERVVNDLKSSLEKGTADREQLGRELVSVSTALKTSNQEKLSLKKQRDTLKLTVDSTASQCQQDIKELVNVKISSLKTIRNALHRTRHGPEVQIQDCSVSDWSEGACVNKTSQQPLSCDNSGNGGVRVWKRTVTTPANEHGLACGRLTMELPCGQTPCPVSCSVSNWTAWSECSAQCDSGSQSRSRTVLQLNKYGGDVCPSLFEDRTCSGPPCSKDCVLSGWTEYGSCSVPCSDGIADEDGGANNFKRRRKIVLEKEEGEGSCPKVDDPKRLELKPCVTGVDVPRCPTAAGVGGAGVGLSMVPKAATGGYGGVPIMGRDGPIEQGKSVKPTTPEAPSTLKCAGKQDIMLAFDLSQGLGSNKNLHILQDFAGAFMKRISGVGAESDMELKAEAESGGKSLLKSLVVDELKNVTLVNHVNSHREVQEAKNPEVQDSFFQRLFHSLSLHRGVPGLAGFDAGNIGGLPTQEEVARMTALKDLHGGEQPLTEADRVPGMRAEKGSGAVNAHTQVGVIGFGQGQVQEDGTTSPAELLLPLTNSLSKQQSGVDLKWYRGFSNPAQALALAHSQLQQNARSGENQGVEQVVVLFTSGTIPTVFKDQVLDVTRKMRDMGVRLVVVALMSPEECTRNGEALAKMRGWVGEDFPELNFLKIPGYGAVASPSERERWADHLALRICNRLQFPGVVERVE